MNSQMAIHDLAAMLRPMLVARAVLREQYGVLHNMVLERVRRKPTYRRAHDDTRLRSTDGNHFSINP